MIILVVEFDSLFSRRRGVGDAYGVLDQPLVDRLCRVGHEYPAAEVRFGQDIGERGSMIEMETICITSDRVHQRLATTTMKPEIVDTSVDWEIVG